MAGFDEGQKRAIEVTRNAAVRAGAGSGKTTVLAARYLHLVREREVPVESILALTFTNKAASQMFERIHRELSGDKEASKGLGAFSDAEISTFDAFCARVARSVSAVWGVSPDFSPGGAEGELLASECMSFLLEHLDEAVVSRLLGAWGLAGLRDGILVPAAARMGPARQVDFSSMPDRLRAILEADISKGRSIMESARSLLLDLPSGTATLEKVRSILASELPPRGDDAALLEICKRLSAPNVLHARNVGKQFSESSSALKGALPSLMSALETRLTLPSVEGLYPLLDRLWLRVVEAKRRTGLLSFSDVAEMAVEGLRRDAALRDHYRNRFRAIMVDEFQDDNQLQKDLIDLILPPPGGNEPRQGVLFCVGDEKQSIYRFRGADVRVFSRLARELEGDDESLALRVNYRSEPALVAFCNALFERVMAGAAEDYEARFAPALTRDPTPALAPRIIRMIQEKPTDADAQIGAVDSEAWNVVRFIKAAVEGDAPLMVRDKEAGARGEAAVRRARYGDFAILFRTYSRQAAFERFLRLEGIPYAAETIRSFYSEAPFADFHAVFRLTILPGDRLALVEYLRSPFARLSDDALVLLLSWPELSASADPREALRSLCAEPPGPGIPDLGAGERTKLRRAMATLDAVAAMADKKSLAAIVEWLWTEGGYRFSILGDPSAHSYLEYRDYLFTLAEQADREGRGMASFAAGLQGLAGSEERLEDFSPPLEREEGVHLMTIFKAKGLEFPAVILPSLESYPQSNASKAGAWDEEGFFSIPLFVEGDEEGAPPAKGKDHFLERRKEREKAFAQAEMKRLFYVACTRAECHLVLSEIGGGKQDCRSLRSLLDAGWDAVETMAETRVNPPVSLDEYRSLRRRASSRVDPVDALDAVEWASVIDRPRRLREFSATELNALRCAALGIRGIAEGAVSGDGEAAEPGDGEGASGTEFGTFVHLILQKSVEAAAKAARAGHEVVSEPVMPRDDEIPPQVAGWLSEGKRTERLRLARELAAGFLASPTMRRALRNADTLRTEEPFIMRVDMEGGGECFVRGVIDLLFKEGGVAVVVDYKTNLAVAEGEYALQMSLYRRAACALLGTDRAESWLHYLRDGRSIEESSDVDCAPFMKELMEKK